MFKAVAKSEFGKVVTSASFYVFAFLLLLAAYLNTSNVNPRAIVISVFGKAWHNAPLFLAREMAILSVAGILFTIKIVGRSVVKDFQAKTHDFYFTAPMSKLAYLGGRFFGSFSGNLLLYLGYGLGVLFACSTIGEEFYGPHRPAAYLFAFFVMAAPNVLLIASIFFCLATLSRKMMLTYMAGVGFVMLYGIAIGGLPFSEHETARALADPFGISALSYITKYWTVAEINNNLIPFDRLLILNRILWLSCSTAILVFTFNRFKFVSKLEGRKERRPSVTRDPQQASSVVFSKISAARIDRSLLCQVRKCLNLASREFHRIAFHPAFVLITLAALAQVGSNFMLQSATSQKYPLTSTYLDQAGDVIAYMWPITLFFCGVIVWRERDDGSNELYDTLAVPDWMSYLAKLLTIAAIQLLVVLLLLMLGIFLQIVVCRYTDIELGLYLKTLFGINLVSYWLWAILFLFIQNLASNKYLGFGLSTLVLVAVFVGLPKIENVDTSLLRYGFLPHYIYSNLTGYGHYAGMILAYTIYWLLFAAVLMIASSLLWRRNNETRLALRIRVAAQNVTATSGILLGGFLAAFVLVGIWIFYNNHVLNRYHSVHSSRLAKVKYEKGFKQYDDAPQPDITDVMLNVALFPEERNVSIEGHYILKNYTSEPISELLICLSRDRITEIDKLHPVAEFEQTVADKDSGCYVFRLNDPLRPGASTKFEFAYEVVTKGFSISNPMNELAHNGTCLTSVSFQEPLYFPLVGYNDARELHDDRIRETFGLAKKRIPTVEEYRTLERRSQMPANYEAIISTSGSQRAITNGRLERAWVKDGRNYFHYRTETPVNLAFAILSGRYAAKMERYQGVDIEVYYDEKHDNNVPRMINGVKESLDYCSSNYSAYPHSVIRVAEVPEFGMSADSIAFSLPTLFMWRESGGFISNVEDPQAVDYVFHITAHEMAHQWWAHSVKTAIIEGGGLPAETLARWVELMCLQRQYGRDKAQKFLEDERKKYLLMRKNETDEEQPIVRSHFQGYLMYAKGCLAMHAMKEYIGEDRVNAALKRIVERFPLDEPRVATANDVVAELRAVTPDELQYLVTDLFETITLHDNKAESAAWTRLDDGTYKVHLAVSSRKLRADGQGKETEVPLADQIYIGVLDQHGKELYLEKHRFDANRQDFEIAVPSKPHTAGIDPHRVLIDRNVDDNLLEVSELLAVD